MRHSPLWLVLILLACTLRAGAADLGLRAGPARLTLAPVPPGQFGARIASPGVFVQDAPLAVEVVDAKGAAVWLTGAY